MNKRLLSLSAFVVGFAAMMLATWFVEHGAPTVGLYNYAIALVAGITFVAVRSQH